MSIARGSKTRDPGAAIPSIAVLPFSHMSPQKDQDYCCDDMAEELINALAALPGLQVTSRTSAFQIKGQRSTTRRLAPRGWSERS